MRFCHCNRTARAHYSHTLKMKAHRSEKKWSSSTGFFAWLHQYINTSKLHMGWRRGINNAWRYVAKEA